MKTMHYKDYNETHHQFLLHQRLPVHIISKPNYSKTYVTLTTPLGANHQGYYDAFNQKQLVPSGIAHFLEHKIFEYDGNDISSAFSQTEASINAFTEYTKTTYLFHATNYLNENIKRLVEMVFFPKFTAIGIEKEKNIIQEELNMYLDNPYYLQYKEIIQDMYQNHPIKEDILGNKQSIHAISYEACKAMHEAYYQPELCRLIIIGNVDPKALKKMLETEVILPKITTLSPIELSYPENAHVNQYYRELFLDVLKPAVLMGIKLDPNMNLPAHDRVKKQLVFTMFCDLMLGKNSDLYEELMNAELINDSYGLDISFEKDHAYAFVSSETDNPEALHLALKQQLANISNFIINPDDFHRIQKQMIGSFIQSLDSLEYVSNQMNRYLQDGLIFYDVVSIAQAITYHEVQALAHPWIQENQISTVIVYPKK